MGEQEQQDKSLTLVEHLQELRVRIVWIIVFFIIALVIGFFLAEPTINFFKQSEVAKDIPWNVFAFSDAVRVYLQFAFMIAVIISLPFILFQIWRFMAPGLTKKERRTTAWFIPIAFLLFIIGASFAYFILFPMIISFLSKIANQLGVQEMYGISQYFGFMFNIIIPFGLLFELPIIIIFLTQLGIVKPDQLIKFRKFAYLILVIIAASITPPELITNILVSVPLILLYEFSIWLAKITARKKEKAREKMQKEMLEDED